jgi:hypothetical protein
MIGDTYGTYQADGEQLTKADDMSERPYEASLWPIQSSLFIAPNLKITHGIIHFVTGSALISLLSYFAVPFVGSWDLLRRAAVRYVFTFLTPSQITDNCRFVYCL